DREPPAGGDPVRRGVPGRLPGLSGGCGTLRGRAGRACPRAPGPSPGVTPCHKTVPTYGQAPCHVDRCLPAQHSRCMDESSTAPGAHRAADHGGPAAARAKSIGEALISARGVDKFFGDFQALKGIDLDIRRGEVVALIGASGSGKSTLCRCLNRLETITSGQITIDGEQLPEEGKALTRLRADVAMVFQGCSLSPHLRAVENVTQGPRRVRGVAKAAAGAQAMELLERVGLAHKAHSLPAALSGGQQQRVATARSLAMKPKAMLFDEPTSALDP